MHQTDFDLSLEEIAKIEGHASLTLKVRGGQVADLQFQISEFKRFYTQAIRGKEIASIPQLVSRICGTCSNAHLLCSLEAIEKALGIIPSVQTVTLRRLLINGLMIRDHGLHLYVFALPDIYGKNSLLDFEESDANQRELLEEAFLVKAAGNKLGVWAGGRSVHAPYPTIGGFIKLPEEKGIKELIKSLQKARPAVLRLIEIFRSCLFSQEEDFDYVALKNEKYDFLEGCVGNSTSPDVCEFDYGKHLDLVVIPYSQAVGYKFEGRIYQVGALARINLSKDKLHLKTQESAKEALSFFSSKNIYHNNLAQVIEILHCLDDSLEILGNLALKEEKPLSHKAKEATGVGVIEAPRGTLYYKLETTAEGKIKRGDIVVPTGQNQIAIEKAILHFVQKNLHLPKEKLIFEIEKIIRAFDPCMSCAAHFLKVKWL